MNRARCCRVIYTVSIVLAFAAVGGALAGGVLGLDLDMRWGPFRILLLVLGLAVLVPVAILRGVDAIDRSLMGEELHHRSRGTPAGGMRPSQPTARRGGRTPDCGGRDSPRADSAIGPTDTHRDDAGGTPHAGFLGGHILFQVAAKRVALPLSFVCVELLYVWFVSVGYWRVWPATSSFYGLLGDAFIRGQTDLLVEPPPQLALLDNPYSARERGSIPVIGDASYFEGSYSVYWGPAPAALVAVWLLISHRSVGDQYVVFFAVSTILVFSWLSILYFKRMYYPSLPRWLLASALALVATVHPMLWVLNRPAIWEAAIACGQAFLLAGLYFALPILDGSIKQPRRCLLVGALWSLALGSRLTLVGAIGFLTVAMCKNLLSEGRGRLHLIAAAESIAALTLPIVFSMALLGMYNYLRFGSVLETGLRYQLSHLDFNQLFAQGYVFNAAYLPANLLYYLAAPNQFRSVFPFVRPVWDQIPRFAAVLAPFNVPSAYHVEDVSGIMFSAPALLLMVPVVRALACGNAAVAPGQGGGGLPMAVPVTAGPVGRMLRILLLASLLAALPVFLYFWVATRFLLDTTPLLAIVVSLGLWLLYYSNRAYPFRGCLIALTIILAIAASVLASILLAVTGAETRFDDLNPSLWQFLVNLFKW